MTPCCRHCSHPPSFKHADECDRCTDECNVRGVQPPLLDEGAWQCFNCRRVHLGPWTPICQFCERVDSLSGSVDPALVRLAREKR